MKLPLRLHLWVFLMSIYRLWRDQIRRVLSLSRAHIDFENDDGISFETNSGQRGSFQDNDISGLIEKA